MASRDHVHAAGGVLERHTPGPWDFDEGDLSVYAIDGRGHSVPLFQPHEECDGEVLPFAEAVANARLIAAAPDLLEALKALVETFRREASGTPLNNHRFDALGAKANAALAKAEGRS